MGWTCDILENSLRLGRDTLRGIAGRRVAVSHFVTADSTVHIPNEPLSDRRIDQTTHPYGTCTTTSLSTPLARDDTGNQTLSVACENNSVTTSCLSSCFYPPTIPTSGVRSLGPIAMIHRLLGGALVFGNAQSRGTLDGIVSDNSRSDNSSGDGQYSIHSLSTWYLTSLQASSMLLSFRNNA